MTKRDSLASAPWAMVSGLWPVSSVPVVIMALPSCSLLLPIQAALLLSLFSP